LERLRADKGNDPEFEKMLGEGYFFMGDIQGSPIQASLGDLAGSFAWYRKALAILAPLADQHPSNSRYQLDLCDALERIAVAFQHSGKDREALEYNQKHLDASRRAAALAPDDPRAVAQIGYATRDLGLLLGASDPGRAEPYTREGLEVFQRLVKRDPENPDFLDNTAQLLNQLATIASSRHELKQAADHIRQGADIRERLLKLKPDDTQRQRGLWLSYARLGDILAGAFESLGDTQGAIGYYRKSMALANEMLAKDPTSKTAQSDLANLKVRLGSVLSSDDQRQESLALLSEALASLDAGLAASPKNALLRFSAANVLSLMAVRLRSADPVRALECARRAIAHLTAPGVPASAEFQGRIAVTRQLTAVLLAEADDRSGALEQSRQARNAYERQAGSASPGAQGTGPRYWRYAGEMYYVLARKKEASPDQRLADWRAARDAYGRSAAEWRQSLATRRQAELAQLEPKIAECEAAIASAAR
ncbi:MAG TPA: hypothetical protein VGZ73_03920, partial [Bryobacteraceae bacterium]|nr:hypothetical protein [Bryobacteraceae bacterium]